MVRIRPMRCAISLAAMIPRCQRGGPGSTPGWRTAVVAQLGERQTEDLKVPDSISGGGIFCTYFFIYLGFRNIIFVCPTLCGFLCTPLVSLRAPNLNFLAPLTH